MRNNSKGFAQIIVIVLLLLLVGGASYYLGTKKSEVSTNTGPVFPPSATPNGSSGNCNKDEEYIINQQNSQGGCVKRPKDAGKSCTQSSECESGYCVTKEIKATKGICYNSNYNIPCSDCYWTIEASQKAKGVTQTAGGGETTISPCCAY